MEAPSEMSPAHPEFWDTFYAEGEGSNGRYEWFMEYEGYQHLVELVPKKEGMNVLHVGCGNSGFSDSYSGHWREDFECVITNIDICPGLIEEMQKSVKNRKKSKGRTQAANVTINWEVMDCCNLPTPDCSYDFVFDKGTVDALLSQCDDTTEAFGNKNVFSYFKEIYRILKPGGSFLLITINAPDVILPYAHGADGESDFDWDVETHSIDKKKSKSATVHSHGGFNSAYLLVKSE